jgi:hypothetical protein
MIVTLEGIGLYIIEEMRDLLVAYEEVISSCATLHLSFLIICFATV